MAAAELRSKLARKIKATALLVRWMICAAIVVIGVYIFGSSFIHSLPTQVPPLRNHAMESEIKAGLEANGVTNLTPEQQLEIQQTARETAP